MRQNVLLTGTTGFIGRHVAKRLHSEGHTVVSLQRSPEIVDGTSESIVVHDFTKIDFSTVLQGRKFDWLIHLAGAGVHPRDRSENRILSTNIDATRRLIQTASQWPASAIFVACSGSAYDLRNVQSPVSEAHSAETKNLYGASKAAGSITALAIASHHNIPMVVGRMFGVFGPGEPPHRLLPTLIRGLMHNQRVPLSHGLQKRDMIFIDDVVEAILAATNYINDHQKQLALNISTGKPITVREFAEAVASSLGIPNSLLGFGDIQTRPDETPCFSGDPSLIQRLTGWQAKTRLPEAIARSVREFDL